MPSGAKPGERRGGRQKGTPNKLSKSVKDAVMEALHAGDGATAFFIELKENDPRTFATICGKLLPKQLTGADDQPLIPENSFATREERLEAVRRIAFAFAKAEHELQ